MLDHFKRSGSNSEYQLVDERIVGNAPKSLTDAQAAAMPLTSLTAYEALFEQLSLSQDKKVMKVKPFLLLMALEV